MLGSSYGTKNYEEHERNRSIYYHKPVVQRWTTPSCRGDDDEDVGEGGDPSGGDPDGVSTSNLLCSSLRFRVSVFVQRSPPENSSGSYI